MDKSSIEIERKYIIRIPDIEKMRAEAGYGASEILQIYLSSPRGVTHRIRKRASDGNAVYTETKKTRIDKMSCYEDERVIGESEFLSLSENMREGTQPIKKTRHVFVYDGHTFEVDVYPAWKSSCILETELGAASETVKFPDFIEVIAEVTGNPAYSNSAMSKSFPEEIIES